MNAVKTMPWRRNTVLFLGSQAITLFGSSIVQMAIIWQVALTTSSGLWVTLMTLSATIPQTILSFFGGVWADRYSRKRLIILADSGIAVVTLFLAVVLVSGMADKMLPLLLVVSALRSLGAGIQTPAVSSVIPQIVPQEHLMRYNGISSSVMSIVQFAAPAAAGAILTIGPFHWILLLDVVTAIVGILILLGIDIPHTEPDATRVQGGFFTELKAGISYAVTDRPVRRLLLTFGLFIFLSVPSGFLAVLMIERTFGDSYLYLTAGEMAGFAGMVLGGALLGVLGGFKNRNLTLLAGLLGYGIASIALGVSYIFWIFAALLFLVCLFIPIVQSSITTMLQERVPEEKLGRVFGLFGAMYSGFMPLGMVLFGPLADAVKIQYMVVACGVAMLLLGVYAYLCRANRLTIKK